MRERFARRLCGVALAALVGCGDGAPPPGPAMDAPSGETRLAAPGGADATASAAGSGTASTTNPLLPGGGEVLLSIAMRTWVYQKPDPESTKLGYLRAGATVARSRAAHGTTGCDGGWYQVAPRGYVCNGKGATTDLEHPIHKALPVGAKRGEAMPYRYVISRKPPPHLYFKLPSLEQQKEAEGRRRATSLAMFNELQRKDLGELAAVPAYLKEGDALPKPYGAERPLHYQVHRGRADAESAFGIVATYDWTDRAFGLTSELDLIPLDRTKLVRLSPMRGVEVKDGAGTPAFVVHHGVFTHEPDALGNLQKKARASFRSGWVLTGKEQRGLMETAAGPWLPKASLKIAAKREDPAGFARDGKKWIDVSIRNQLLVAYRGHQPVFATLISSGRGEMGDPEETHATVRGTYMIHAKHVSDTMDGDDGAAEPFDLRDVPYIQYFHKGYALHGAYWHDDFGKARSHGCINLAPSDAAWLFEWTDPAVPKGWHGALNRNAGTLVYIHG